MLRRTKLAIFCEDCRAVSAVLWSVLRLLRDPPEASSSPRRIDGFACVNQFSVFQRFQQSRHNRYPPRPQTRVLYPTSRTWQTPARVIYEPRNIYLARLFLLLLYFLSFFFLFNNRDTCLLTRVSCRCLDCNSIHLEDPRNLQKV